MIVHFIGCGNCACAMPMPPGSWPEGHQWTASWDEVTCPECLKGKEPIDTFTIQKDANGRETITCKRGGLTSYNSNDILQQYCGACHVYHDDIWPPARHWWIHSMRSEIKVKPHEVLPGQQIVEVWFKGQFIATVTGADGPGVRIISRHPLSVKSDESALVLKVATVTVQVK